MENGERQRREAMNPEAEAPRPPRRISDAPSARGLKPRRVSAVRHFPPGCGRFPPPPPPPSPPAVSLNPTQDIPCSSSALASASATATASATVSEKKYFYSPPKRRSVSAQRSYPPGCGRGPDFSLHSSYIHPPLQNSPSEQVNPQDQEEEVENDDGYKNAMLSDHKSEKVASSAAAINRSTRISTDHDDDDAAHSQGAQEFRETVLCLPAKPASVHSRLCANESVAGTSRPSLSLVQRKPTKKERRVAKKSIPPLKEDRLVAQLSNLMTPTLPPVAISDSDARGYVNRILDLFQKEFSLLSEAKTTKATIRIDLEAMNNVKKSSEYVKRGSVVGHVPGVEVGDKFGYRAELHLIGLHFPLQSGIDWTKIDDIPVATSVVESGGYSDGMDGSDVLIYTGSGGQPTGKKGQKTLPQDQKLQGGNLALKNSMDRKELVRVIRGLNVSKSGRSVMTFTYDGLYMVEEVNYVPEKYKVDGKEYTAKVYKFKMRRKRIQPEVGLHVATMSKNSEVREGLCVANISKGKKKEPGGTAMDHVSRPGGPHQGG